MKHLSKSVLRFDRSYHQNRGYLCGDISDYLCCRMGVIFLRNDKHEQIGIHKRMLYNSRPMFTIVILFFICQSALIKVLSSSNVTSIDYVGHCISKSVFSSLVHQQEKTISNLSVWKDNVAQLILSPRISWDVDHC